MSQQKNTPPQSLRPFFTIWGGQAVSLIGSQLVQFGLVWYLTESTGSATILALATLVALLPQIVISPIAGALVDRWDRRTVMFAADSFVAAATMVLAALFWLDVIQVWHIYLLMFIRALGGAFHWPAMQASTPLLVPEKHLSRIAGLNQGLMGIAGIIAPPLGALLITVMPMQGLLFIDVATAAFAIAPLLFIHIPNPPKSSNPAAPSTSVMADLRGGLQLVSRWFGLKAALIMAMLINLLITPAFALLPIMVIRYFNGAALELAWMQAAWGIGMAAGGILLGIWGGFKTRMLTTALALIGMGGGLAAVGLVPATAYTLALIALFISGIMNPMVNGSMFATLQATVPADMQGRIFTLIMSGSSLMSPLGLLIAGPLADTIGTQAWFLIGGILTAVMGLIIWVTPSLLHFEKHSETVLAKL